MTESIDGVNYYVFVSSILSTSFAKKLINNLLTPF